MYSTTGDSSRFDYNFTFRTDDRNRKYSRQKHVDDDYDGLNADYQSRRNSDLIENYNYNQQSMKTTGSETKQSVNNDQIMDSNHHHPITVRVSHQPSEYDVSRVYNPYPFQNEYQSYFKTELIKNSIHDDNSSTSTVEPFYGPSLSNKRFANYMPKKQRLLSPSDYSKKRRQQHASVNYVNKSFIEEKETEFQNLNQLNKSRSINEKYNSNSFAENMLHDDKSGHRRPNDFVKVNKFQTDYHPHSSHA